MSYKIGSFHLSFHLSFCLPRCFLGILSLVFSNFFCSQDLENWSKGGQKQVFLNLLKNLIINFNWSSSIMKTFIICCVPVEIPYLGKFLFLGYRPKCSQPIRLQDFLINHISRTNQWKVLWWYKLTYIKSWSKIFWLGMARSGYGQFGYGTLKLTVYLENEWWNELIFRMLVQIHIAKLFHWFCVGVVRNEHGHFVHEILKSAGSKEWVYELSWFFGCWLWGNSFLLDQYCTLYLWLLNVYCSFICKKNWGNGQKIGQIVFFLI